VTAAAGSIAYNVLSNAGWNVASNASWCTVTPSGWANGTIQAAFQENETSEPRTAQITISVMGLSPVVVTLTQNGVLTRALSLSLLLEGLYTGEGEMHPAMDENGIHWGPTVADRIFVELHDGANYNNLVFSMQDVDLHTNGTANFSIPSNLSGNYYISIRHRNSIETVSANPVSFSGSSVSYAFNLAEKAFGNNLRQMPDGYFTIWSGDSNQDGLVDSSDMVMIDNDSNIFATGYILSDLNGDGLTDSSDMVILDNNASQFIAKVIP
jgi:hypothetical protein